MRYLPEPVSYTHLAGNEIAKLYADNKVDIIIYAVEKSLDSYKFNLLHCKQTFISQLKSGALGARTIDEGAMDEKSGMNFSEYMAILSGNTDLLDKAKLEKKIASLEGERKSLNRGKRDSELKLKSKSEELDGNRAILKGMTADYDKFRCQAKKDKDGNILNLITLNGCLLYTSRQSSSPIQEHQAAISRMMYLPPFPNSSRIWRIIRNMEKK